MYRHTVGIQNAIFCPLQYPEPLFAFIWIVSSLFVNLFKGENVTNEDIAKKWLKELDLLSVETAYTGSTFGWNFQTDINSQNAEVGLYSFDTLVILL